MDTTYLYNILNEETKRLLYLSFIEFGFIKSNYIDIDPTLIERILTKIITTSEKTISATHQGNNKLSFDIIITYDSKIIAISIKTIREDNLDAKFYEMSCLKNEITSTTETTIAIDKILKVLNERYDYEKVRYNIDNFQVIYFEKHQNKVEVLCDNVRKVTKEDIIIESIEKTDSRISFVANNEKYKYTFCNNTLTITRNNAITLDNYYYEENEILDIDTKIDNFILKNTKTTKENNMNLQDFETLDLNISGQDLLNILNNPELRKLERMVRVTFDNETFRKIKQNHTTTNRDIKKRKVKEYKKAMLNGEWNPNIGNTIMFDKDGNLADGNHRVLGGSEIEEPIAITMWVNIGGERSSAIDTGAKRNLDDKIKYLNYVPENIRHLYSKEFSYMLALYCHFFNSPDKQNTDKGQAELAKEFFERFPKEFEEFTTPWEINKKKYNIYKCKYTNKPSVLLALFNNFLNKNINKEDIKHIVEVLDTGIAYGPQDAQIIGLKEFMDAKTKEDTGDSYSSKLYKAADQFIKGYKKGIRNKKVSIPQTFLNDICRLGGDKTIHLKEYVA